MSPCADIAKIRLPWFRVHIVILNDPGRLISGLAAGWSGAITFYELITLDPTDPVYNPIWRQGCYVIPFISRLGVIRSLPSIFIGLMKQFTSAIFHSLGLLY